MNDFSPGCLAAWIVALVLIALGVRAFRRHLARERARKEERKRELLGVAESFGFRGSHAVAPPGDLPDFPLTRIGTLPRQAAVAERDGATLVLFDHVVASEGTELGLNTRITGTDESRREVSRHTVVCLRSPRLRSVRLEVLPDVKSLFEGAMPSLGEGESAMAKAGMDLVAGLVQRTLSKREREGALSIAGLEELDGAYRIYAADAASATSVLTPAVKKRLLASAGLILGLEGSWLVASRNVQLSTAGPAADLDFGLLSIGAARHLADDVIALERYLSEE